MEIVNPTPLPAPGSGPPFTILRQDHSPVYGADGRESSEWTIYFSTPSGVESFVKVADADYTVENVGRQIAGKVAEIEAVHQLGAGA